MGMIYSTSMYVLVHATDSSQCNKYREAIYYMNKRLIERIGMAAVIAAFVAYFCYQVAYGQTAIITAPPGSTIGNVTIAPITGHYIHLYGTWNFVNGSISGKITFHEACYHTITISGCY